VIAISFGKGKKMITQAIKRWLHQMFAWWPWRPSAKTAYAPPLDSLNSGPAQETTAWSASDGVGVAPQPEVAPRRPIIEEWPERIVQPYPPTLEERSEIPFTSPPMPPIEKAGETTSNSREGSSPDASATSEQKLAFLRYLVKRGILNEGFAEDKVPDQYRRKNST
jgi:hypothetical protein